MNKSISAYMTSSPVMLQPDEPLSAAEQIFAKHRIRHIPVVRDQTVCGVLSDREVQFVAGFSEGRTDKVKVADVMTESPFVVTPDAPLSEVASVMADARFGSAVVVEGGKPVGVFTATDALRVLAALLR